MFNVDNIRNKLSVRNIHVLVRVFIQQLVYEKCLILKNYPFSVLYSVLFHAARKSNCVREVEKMKIKREERRARHAEQMAHRREVSLCVSVWVWVGVFLLCVWGVCGGVDECVWVWMSVCVWVGVCV